MRSWLHSLADMTTFWRRTEPLPCRQVMHASCPAEEVVRACSGQRRPSAAAHCQHWETRGEDILTFITDFLPELRMSRGWGWGSGQRCFLSEPWSHISFLPSVTSSHHIDRSVHCVEGKWRWWQEDAMRHKELVFSHPLCPVSSLTLPLALSLTVWSVAGQVWSYAISNFLIES